MSDNSTDIIGLLKGVIEKMDAELSMVPGTYELPLSNHLLDLLYISMVDL